jgi:AhpC/TSA family
MRVTTNKSISSIMLLLLAIYTVIIASFEEIRAMALRPRNAAPLFTAKAVIDDSFITVSLKKYAEDNKWVVLLFYPYDHTFVCPVSEKPFHIIDKYAMTYYMFIISHLFSVIFYCCYL